MSEASREAFEKWAEAQYSENEDELVGMYRAWKVLAPEIAELKAERDEWKETARLENVNRDYWRARVEELEEKARLLDSLTAQIKVSMESGLSLVRIDDVYLTGNLEVRDE